ncbi:MAG: 2-oxoglutarate and iron-dependent oxygenase domain-containing protein [Acidimicrobiales bacterium]
MTGIPTIDLRSSSAAAEIGVAGETVGFFQIVGHGVDPAVIDTAWREARRFFDLPLADRMTVAQRDGDAYGFSPMEREALERSLGTMDGAADLKQTFNVGPLAGARIDLDDPVSAWAFGPTPWPAAQPSLEPAMRAYFDAMDALARRLLQLFAIALGQPHDFFDPFVDHAPGALRALDYPELGDRSPAPGQLRAGAHTDYGTLTILRQDDAPGGLEVLDPRTDEWTPVPARADGFVVNLGDLMQRWTNDRWRSTMHRVVAPPSGSGPHRRQSMAFFHNANVDARIEVIPTCIAPDAVAAHAPVIAGPHLWQKFTRATM